MIYPEDKGLKVNRQDTCNFSHPENFVVFECVHRLLEKGYKPEHLELEPTWQVGHGASGGRADILVKDQENNPLLIIECKTAGDEFERAWRKPNKMATSYLVMLNKSSKRNTCVFTLLTLWKIRSVLTTKLLLIVTMRKF